jgi:hypothetical protein
VRLAGAHEYVRSGRALDHLAVDEESIQPAHHVEAFLGAVMYVHRRACRARRRIPLQKRVAAGQVFVHVRDCDRTDAYGRN